MERFVGKSAIVTAGSKGLGRAIADRLASEGTEVLITARGEEAFEHVLRNCRPTGSASLARWHLR